MSGNAQPCAPHIEPFERAKKLFLEQLSEDERITYQDANPENLFYQASVLHSGYIRSSKLQKCRETLMPLVGAVKEYGELLATPLSSASVVGTFVSPIWGSLRVVIHFAQAVDEYFDNLIAMLGRIGETLPQYSDYHRIFPNHGRLMLLLSESLASILTFCKKVKDHFNSEENCKRWSDKLLGHRASRKKIGLSVPDYLDDFENAKRRIEQEAQLSHMIEDKEHHDRQEEHWALQEGRSRQTRLKEALSTLSKVNYKNQRQQLQSERYTSTGQWLIQEPSFTAWIRGPTSSCFYCFGIPGSGKSVLSSAIMDHLDQEFTTPEDIHGFYFCDYKDHSSLKCSTLLGTLIRQALDLTPRPQMLVDWVLERVDEGNSQPSTDELVDTLKRVMGSRKRVFLVLDGIDELDHAEQINLRRAMQSFLSLEQSIVKIFISCRAGVLELDSDPYPAVKLTITPDHVRDDIRHYIEQTVESKYRSEELQLGNASLKKEIIQALSAGAKEMFLWVKFQIEELCLCYNDEEIRETLKDLPEGLADTYARILQKISNSKRGPKSLEIACSAFQWVICSARPLLVEELLEALAIRESDSTLHRDRVITDTRKLIQACGNLITIQFDGTVRPAHHTVQKFLLRDDAEKKDQPEGLSNGDGESPLPRLENNYVATNAGSVNSSHLRGIEHVRFFFEEGDRRLGRLCIAYLQFEDFESQVAIRQPDRMQMPAGIVKSIGSDFHGPSAVAAKVMTKVQRHSTPGTNVRNISLSLPRLDNQDKKKTFNQEYKLLEYVRLFWPFHLNNFSIHDDDGLARVTEIARAREFPFETRPWRTTQFKKSIPRFRGEKRNQQYHEARHLFYWALKSKVRLFHHLLENEKITTSEKEPTYAGFKYRWKYGLLDVIVVHEAAQDTYDQSLIQTAARWGPDQLHRVIYLFRLVHFPCVPFSMLHQAFVVGSHEVRQSIYNAYDMNSSEPVISFESWPVKERFSRLGQPTAWFARKWGNLSANREEIMRTLFLVAYGPPSDTDLLRFIFPLLEIRSRDEEVGWIIQNAESDIRKASDDTKRSFIIESLVGILYPGNEDEVSSIRIEGDMSRWQHKWDCEVDDARHRASLKQAIEVVKKKEGGESGDENGLKIAREKIEEMVRQRGSSTFHEGRSSVVLSILQLELQAIAVEKDMKSRGREDELRLVMETLDYIKEKQEQGKELWDGGTISALFTGLQSELDSATGTEIESWRGREKRQRFILQELDRIKKREGD